MPIQDGYHLFKAFLVPKIIRKGRDMSHAFKFTILDIAYQCLTLSILVAIEIILYYEPIRENIYFLSCAIEILSQLSLITAYIYPLNTISS